MSGITRFASIVLGCSMAVSCGSALAQDFPTRPIRLIIPNAPGGIDAYARIMTTKLGDDLGQPIVIENRPGASGIIGSEAVARAAPDGHTLLMATSAILVTVQFLNKNMPFDPQKDLTPISQVLGIVSTLAVRAGLPVNNVAELVDYAKRNPGKLTFGSSGIGTLPHLNGEILKSTAGIDMLHVPFKGAKQLATELAAGRLDVDLTGLGPIGPHVASGKARLIALLGSSRFGPAGNVPSINETIPAYRDAPAWVALLGPAGLPRPLVARLHAAVVKTMSMPDVRAGYEKVRLRVIASSPEELAQSMREGSELVGKVVKAIGLKPE